MCSQHMLLDSACSPHALWGRWRRDCQQGRSSGIPGSPSVTCASNPHALQARLWQDQKMTYGTLLPDNTISLLLGLVRSLEHVHHITSWGQVLASC